MYLHVPIWSQIHKVKMDRNEGEIDFSAIIVRVFNTQLSNPKVGKHVELLELTNTASVSANW
jgi:hypothetical protein